jgi:hypothetical protein
MFAVVIRMLVLKTNWLMPVIPATQEVESWGIMDRDPI